VGGSAQIAPMKQAAGMLRLELAQYRELAAFAQFGADLDAVTRRQLHRGQRLMELMKQPQYKPMPVERQVISIFAATNGFIDAVEVKDVATWEAQLHGFMDSSHKPLMDEIASGKKMSDEFQKKLKAAFEDFMKRYDPNAGKS
jgi:F-type H+-transporting ATPase subunit alpha